MPKRSTIDVILVSDDVMGPNYDQLTAKDVANRIQRLSAPQVAAVLDYERARKKRATVIRAVEQRLAAAS